MRKFRSNFNQLIKNIYTFSICHPSSPKTLEVSRCRAPSNSFSSPPSSLQTSAATFKRHPPQPIFLSSDNLHQLSTQNFAAEALSSCRSVSTDCRKNGTSLSLALSYSWGPLPCDVQADTTAGSNGVRIIHSGSLPSLRKVHRVALIS